MSTLNAAIGEREGAWIVATGATEVSATVDGSALGPLKAAVYFGHFVSFGGRAVPDALLPWNGAARPTEKPNQPLYLQVAVPPDAKPGGYRATVTVTTDGKPTDGPGDDHGLRRPAARAGRASTATSSPPSTSSPSRTSTRSTSSTTSARTPSAPT